MSGKMKKIKKIKKIRLIKLPLDNLAMGLHFSGTNIIILNSRLDKYPRLKKIVYEHEYSHYKEKTLMKGIIRDYKDSFKIYSCLEFYDFYYDTMKLTNQNWIVIKNVFYKVSILPIAIVQVFYMAKESIRRFKWGR